MRRSRRVVGLSAGVLTLVAGALLLMGSFHSDSSSTSQQELKRVEQLARISEARLETARSAFRDLLLRHNIGYVVEHPEDWADWRVWQKFALLQRGWRTEAGELRGLLLITSAGVTHTVWGDTLGAGNADRMLVDSLDADIAFFPNSDDCSASLAFCYRVPPTDQSPQPGHIVALLDAGSVLELSQSLPNAWGLYSSTQSLLLTSANTATLQPVDPATWPLLFSRWSGTLKMPGKAVLVFSKIRAPGMAPLMLVSAIPTTIAALKLLAVFLLIAGSTVIYIAIRRERIEMRPLPVDELSLPMVAPELVSSSEFPQVPDPQSPYPVVYVTPEGLIQLYNEAALKSCPRIKDTPVMSEVLPSLEPHELMNRIENRHGGSFESLFGSRPHSFAVVPTDDGVLLYAHPLSASQTLEVALQQAQENFNTLCAVVPVPILLVDPRNHAITEANPAASEFFRLPPDRIRGRVLDTLSPEPIDLASSHHEFVADIRGELMTCWSHCEMVKIEGAPMILMMLRPPAESLSEGARMTPGGTSGKIEQAPPFRVEPCGPAVLVSLTPVVRDVARRLLERTGHATEAFSSLDDATGWVFSHEVRPEFVAIDISDFPETADWLSEVRRRHEGVACLAITDGVTFGLPCDGPNAYLTKPFDLDSLFGALSLLGLATELVEDAAV